MDKTRKRSNEGHHPSANKPKRAIRIETGKPTLKHPRHHSHEAALDAGDPPLTPKKHDEEPEIDELSAKAALGIAESAARDRGESVPVTPYSRGVDKPKPPWR